MPPTEQSQIIDGFLRGDPGALRALDGWIDVVLHQFAGSLQVDWDDVKQEVRTRVFRNLSRGSFDGRSELRTYVHRISKNVCIDLLRMNRRHRELDVSARTDPPTAGAPPSAAAAWIARDLLAKLLAGLSHEERRLIEMVFVEHCSYAEVSLRLSIPVGTVKSRMARCKSRILKKRSVLIAPEDSRS